MNMCYENLMVVLLTTVSLGRLSVEAMLGAVTGGA